MENDLASKIEIKTEGILSKIYIDGHEIKGVRSFKMSHNANGTPVLTLDLLALNTTIDCGMAVTLREEKYGNIKSIIFEDGSLHHIQNILPYSSDHAPTE